MRNSALGMVAIALVVSVLMAGCNIEPSEVVQARIAKRIEGDYASHTATIVSSVIVPTAHLAEVHKDHRLYSEFMVATLDNGGCIVALNPDPFHNLRNVQVSYVFEHQALSTWPIEVFDGNPDCLPASLQ